MPGLDWLDPLPPPSPLALDDPSLDELDESEDADEELDDPDEPPPSPLPLPLLPLALLSEPDEPDDSSLDADDEEDEHAGSTMSVPLRQIPHRMISRPLFPRMTKHTAASVIEKSQTPGVPQRPVPVWVR